MAETKAVLFTDGKFQGFNNEGEVVPYGKLYFTDADSGIPIPTYTTSTMETENPYPIILSASGKADVYTGDGKFNVTLQDKNGTTVWTINNYIPPGGQIQLDPVTTTSTREEITGITGNTIILENVPLTNVIIHKNGLLLLTTDYTQEGKIITFVDALISSDEIIVEYGQLTPGQIIASEWILQDLIYTYVNSSTFKTNGDTTSIFKADRRVKIDLGASTSYATIISSSFGAGETTVVVDTTAMDNTLVSVSYAIVSPYDGANGGSLSYYTREESDVNFANAKIDQSILITPPTDADYTLTSEENLYGRIEINTSNWTTSRNIICNNVEHTFLAFVNTTGSQNATFKTSAGAGVLVERDDGTNTKGKVLRNNTVDIIEFEASTSTPSITGTATFTNSTNNINLVGVGSLSGLEVGDVIQISGTTTAQNDGEFTVEVITDANNIIVNQAHAGGTTSKSLIDETSTAGVTITLLSKWYDASEELGRGWVALTASRSAGVTYTNPFSRGFKLSIGITRSTTIVSDISVDGRQVVANTSETNAQRITLPTTVTGKHDYILNLSGGTVNLWEELR